MKKVFMIDGGAGRVITAIPALEKYAKAHQNEDWYVFIYGWDFLLWGNKLLQNRCYNPDTKGVWQTILRNADVVVTPEPYRLPSYFRQEKSLVQAFDEIINETNDHSDLDSPNLYFNKVEEKNAANVITDIKSQSGKEKTIVIQPWGSGAYKDRNDVIDSASRSLTTDTYLKLVNKLHKKYNLIYFGEQNLQLKDDPSTKPEADLRSWGALISYSDYFIGCDSVGQHMARAVNTPGTVIFGSTFPINTSYPDYFHIWENKNVERHYSPIRMCGLDGVLMDRLNDGCMDLTDNQIDDIYQQIVTNIEKL